MNIAMKYGDGALQLHLPESLHAGTWSLAQVMARLDSTQRERDMYWGTAIAELGAAGFEEAVRGKRLALLLADGTRDWSPETLLPPLLPLCAAASERLAFLATGTHDPLSPLNTALGQRVARVLGPSWALVASDCRQHSFRHLGTTSRGTRVEFHERAASCDIFLAIADMKNHYFAGYSNPTKYYVPGLASLESVRGNHSLALDPESSCGRHPWHPDPARRTNPLAEDLLEAFELTVTGHRHFALTLVGTGTDVLWAAGGPTKPVTQRGIEFVDSIESLHVTPTRYLVVSPGGAPHDESLYTAQRALELSRAAVIDGGEVLFLAACSEGIGPTGARQNFYEPLTRPLAEIADVSRAAYTLYAHKPVKFARYLRMLKVSMHSDLAPSDVSRIHLMPTDARATLARWVATIGASSDPVDKITFIDDASRLAIYRD